MLFNLSDCFSSYYIYWLPFFIILTRYFWELIFVAEVVKLSTVWEIYTGWYLSESLVSRKFFVPIKGVSDSFAQFRRIQRAVQIISPLRRFVFEV